MSMLLSVSVVNVSVSVSVSGQCQSQSEYESKSIHSGAVFAKFSKKNSMKQFYLVNVRGKTFSEFLADGQAKALQLATRRCSPTRMR